MCVCVSVFGVCVCVCEFIWFIVISQKHRHLILSILGVHNVNFQVAVICMTLVLSALAQCLAS